MSPLPRVHVYLHDTLRQHFGEPFSSLGKDVHWMIRPVSTGLAINVLVNGTLEVPSAWIFDHSVTDAAHSMFKAAITSEADADAFIEQLQKRVKRAEEAGRQ